MGKKTIKRRRKSSFKSRKSQVDAVPLSELKSIISQIKTGQTVSAEAVEKLDAAVDTLGFVTSELEQKGASVRRLRKLLFGNSTETMSNLFPDEAKPDDSNCSNTENSDSPAGKDDDKSAGASSRIDKTLDKPAEKKKSKGHGRNSAKDYTGADKQSFSHESLKEKDICPGCQKGKLYVQKDPARLVRVTGTAPLAATVYELERLRCNLCGEVFTAKGPDGLGKEKYDLKAAVMIALLKYGSGMPFYRLERLEQALGIPLPSSTQWDISYRTAMFCVPIYTELIRQAAQGKVLYNDDTTAQVLKLESQPLIGKSGKERTGVYTSGILSTKDEREIALFFTGRNHAGNNLTDVLSVRNEELSAPIHMCDGLTANFPEGYETLLSNCNSHARREFVYLKEDYIHEVKHILGVYKEVYKNDATAKGMSDEKRLEYHIEHSKPLLDNLKNWFTIQTETEKNIEPNSSLGDAIKYMTDRWEELTLFLRVPGAPLDNNACERILKKAILHRKNAMFFRTENGAYVADLFMSLIHTCELGNVNPFDYLVAIADNADKLQDAPQNWMPWNYQNAISKKLNQ